MKKISEPRTKIQLSLSSVLIEQVKIKAIKEKITFREATTQALTNWVSKIDF